MQQQWAITARLFLRAYANAVVWVLAGWFKRGSRSARARARARSGIGHGHGHGHGHAPPETARF